MKVFKRNAVILTVLLFVCVAVYLNWSYSKKEDAAASAPVDEASDTAANADTSASGTDDTASSEAGAETDGSGLFYTGSTTVSSTRSEYFDSVRLSREQARDSAVETLSAVSTAEAADEDTANDALAEIAEVARRAMLESEIEGLIMAKDFTDCVVYISDDGIKVTVPAPETGLSTAAVARITDIVLQETDFTADDLKIIEVK